MSVSTFIFTTPAFKACQCNYFKARCTIYSNCVQLEARDSSSGDVVLLRSRATVENKVQWPDVCNACVKKGQLCPIKSDEPMACRWMNGLINHLHLPALKDLQTV